MITELLIVSLLGSALGSMVLGMEMEVEECEENQYLEDGVCINCAPCLSYNRQPSRQPRRCGKTIEDCGPCLPGFQAMEWTQGRYSDRCEPIPSSETRSNSKVSAVTEENLPAAPILPAVFIISIGVTLAASFLIATVALSCYCMKKRHVPVPLASRPPDEEAAKMLDDRPPPYEASASEATHVVEVGPERSCNRIFYAHQENSLCGAEPIVRRRDCGDEQHSEDELRLADLDSLSNSSTDTAPDEWVPSDDQRPVNTRPVSVIEDPRPSSPQPEAVLRRTQSLDLDPESRLGIYEGVHVRLSHSRRPPSSEFSEPPSTSQERPGSSCSTPGRVLFSDEAEEPQTPHSFSYSDVNQDPVEGGSSLVPNVSFDSGFESSRRSYISDELELAILLRIKRRRHE